MLGGFTGQRACQTDLPALPLPHVAQADVFLELSTRQANRTPVFSRFSFLASGPSCVLGPSAQLIRHPTKRVRLGISLSSCLPPFLMPNDAEARTLSWLPSDSHRSQTGGLDRPKARSDDKALRLTIYLAAVILRVCVVWSTAVRLFAFGGVHVVCCCLLVVCHDFPFFFLSAFCSLALSDFSLYFLSPPLSFLVSSVLCSSPLLCSTCLSFYCTCKVFLVCWKLLSGFGIETVCASLVLAARAYFFYSGIPCCCLCAAHFGDFRKLRLGQAESGGHCSTIFVGIVQCDRQGLHSVSYA